MKVTDSLLYKFFSGDSSIKENKAIEAWLESDPSNSGKFDKAHRMYVIGILCSDAADVHETRRQRGGRKKIILYTAGIAASLAIGFLAAVRFIAKPVMEIVDSSILISESLPDQRSKVTLPDGTVVELNTGSRIEYPAIFHGNERRVKIEGEAMFDVIHDSDKPFIVETFAYDIKVCGTKFDVIADNGLDEFSTALLEGKVEVIDRDSRMSIMLNPDEIVYKKDGRLHRRQINDALDDHQWTDGIISLAGVPFDVLARRLERCYGVKLSIDRETLPTVHYNYLKVRVSNGIEYALDVLRNGSDFEYRYDEAEHVYHIE